MPILEFSVIVEIPDSDELTHEEIEAEESMYAAMLSDMEEIVGKANYAIDNAEWNYL